MHTVCSEELTNYFLMQIVDILAVGEFFKFIFGAFLTYEILL